MMRTVIYYLRLFLTQAWFAYIALFAWSTPFTYLTSKFGFGFFTMLLFVFIGKFVGIADPVYIVIGNILLMPTSNSIYGVSMTVGNEKEYGTMSYLMGSPAPRGPLFLGRTLFHVIDGMLTGLVGLAVAVVIFRLDLSHTDFLLVFFCVILLTISSCGVGLIMGGISLVTREGWLITTTIGQAFYILAGVNFPVDILPAFWRTIAYSLPLTRGILAARMALAGAGWEAIAPLVAGEALVGAIYIMLGYWIFRMLERRSMVSGMLDTW